MITEGSIESTTTTDLRRWLQATVGVVVGLTLLAACTYGPIGGIRGSGDITSETRDVSDFSEVVLEGSGRVTIEITGEESLTIEAEDNLMPHLTSEIIDGRLVLGTDRGIRPTREIVYTITASSLDGVSISGSGDVEGDAITSEGLTTLINGSGTIELTGLDLGHLEAEISGSGSIRVSGAANDLTVTIPGSGSFNGEDLEASESSVDISGSGAAVVNVSERLDATVSGSGTIQYLGSPSVESTITGSGSISAR